LGTPPPRRAPGGSSEEGEIMIDMTVFALIAFGAWAVLSMKTSRPDGRLVENLHQYRTIMGYIMPTRNQSVVYFDVYLDAERLEAYVAEAREIFHCDITHCCVAAAFTTQVRHPSMNRFSTGHRLYQRNGTYITFSMKRAQLDKKAKLATVKMKLQKSDTFRTLCDRINKEINIERSGTKTYQDKEFDLLTILPRPLLKGGVKALKLLDYYNILPGSFIEKDPLYTSMFVANLGSIGMSQTGTTKRYIGNQKSHHRRRTFQDEFLTFLQKHEMEYDPRYIWD
jgi:hypothetical protein